MATPFPFTLGQTLLASQLNAITTLPSTTKTASHTLVIADQGTRVIMNVATANTVTVNTSIFGAGDIVEIQNIGAGVCTVTAGTATVSSAGPLAIPQFGGGQLFFTSAGVSIFFPSAVTAAASALTLISTTTIGTTVASVTVSSAFSATFDNYKIILSGGASSASSNLGLKLGATTTNYFTSYNRVIYSTAAQSSFTDNNVSLFNRVGSPSANGLQSTFEIFAPFLAKLTTVFGPYVDPTVASGGAGTFTGIQNSTTSFTAFTLTPDSGTLTGGTINVYGYANS